MAGSRESAKFPCCEATIGHSCEAEKEKKGVGKLHISPTSDVELLARITRITQRLVSITRRDADSRVGRVADWRRALEASRVDCHDPLCTSSLLLVVGPSVLI